MATVSETSSTSRARAPAQWDKRRLLLLALTNSHPCAITAHRRAHPRVLVPSSSIFPPPLSLSLSLYEGRMGGDARAECVFSAACFTVPEKKKEKHAAPLRWSRNRLVLWHCAPASYFLNGPKGMWLKAVCSLRACNRLGFKPDPEMNHTAPVDALISSVFWLRGH